MNKNIFEFKALEKRAKSELSPFGLCSFGWFQLDAGDVSGGGIEDLWFHSGDTLAGLLIGNRAEAGIHRMWQVFAESEEYRDGHADPLDRWSERIIDPVAAKLGAKAIYPFGRTVWPFQRFAKEATGMRSSPLGILIHPENGLWQAFRGAIVFSSLPRPARNPQPGHPCDSCADKPCLSACPVDAFSIDGFAVSDCRSHLSGGKAPDCMTIGCRARAACPIGVPYAEEQIRFHMKSFGKA